MNRKTLTIFFVLSLFLVALTSCATKEDPIHDLESLVEKVDKRGDTFTDEDWTKVAEQTGAIFDKMKKYNYTPEEQKQIGKLSLKLQLLTYQKMGYKTLSDALNRAAGAMEEASDMLDTALSDYSDTLDMDSEEDDEE